MADPVDPRAEHVIQIAANNDRFIALTSAGNIWITNRGSSLGWRPLALPPMGTDETAEPLRQRKMEAW
jgi:hypothetical protein